MGVAKQLELFDSKLELRQREQTSTTFIDNMRLPIHRWFRIPMGI
jgi:hypothetical protein